MEGRSAESRCHRHNDSRSLDSFAYALQVYGPQVTQHYAETYAETVARQAMKAPIAVYSGRGDSPPNLGGTPPAETFEAKITRLLSDHFQAQNDNLQFLETKQEANLNRLADKVKQLATKVDTISESHAALMVFGNNRSNL